MNAKKALKVYIDNQLFCLKAVGLLAKSAVKGLK